MTTSITDEVGRKRYAIAQELGERRGTARQRKELVRVQGWDRFSANLLRLDLWAVHTSRP